MARTNTGTGFPFGNAFLYQSPETDRAGQYLLQEENKRHAEWNQQNNAIDNSFKNEFYKIKSGDTNEILDKYNTYKQLRMQTLDPDNQRDMRKFNDIQHQALAAKSDLFDSINQSATSKKQIEEMVADRKAHPERYADNFGDLINAYTNTPLSKLKNATAGGKPVDLTNYDTYRYQGNLTNLQPHLQKAAGTMRELNQVPSVSDDKQQNILTTYKGMNNPYDYYNNLVSGLVGSNSARDLVGTVHYTPEQEAMIESQFQQLQNNPNYKAAYNIPQGMDFPMSAYTTEAGKAARLLAMEHAITNVPVPNVTRSPILSARDAATQKRQETMEGMRQGNAMARIQFRHDLQQSTTQEQAQKVGQLYDQMKQDAMQNPKVIGTPKGDVTTYNMKVTPEVKDVFAYKNDLGHKIEPDEVRFMGDQVYPVFYKKDTQGNIVKENGNNKIDDQHSLPIKEPEFKTIWAKKLLGVSAATKSLNQGGGTTGKFPLPSGKPRTVKQGGYSYQWDENSGEYR